MNSVQTAPAYRHYKPKNLGVVRIHRRDYYLGEFNSPESKERYHRLLAEKFYGALPSLPPPDLLAAISLRELVLRYFEYAEGYYQHNGKPTSELTCIRIALRRLLTVHGDLPAADLVPADAASRRR